MNLSEYQSLSGITVSSSNTALVTAQIARTQAMLETMLGFTLDSSKVNTNLYNELGKTVNECACPSVDTENLQDPDTVTTAYRLYRYNTLDKYFHVDPFKRLNKVKLVFIKQGAGDNGITLKTFDLDEVRVQYGRESWSKYIEHCLDCLCSCDCDDCVQLAVDAEWVWSDSTELPLDLKYVWVDMITWYANCKKDIRSESIDTHSYTKFDRSAPELEPQNLAVIKKYAGPYGSVTVNPV